jgi:hypothetical protein
MAPPWGMPLAQGKLDRGQVLEAPSGTARMLRTLGMAAASPALDRAPAAAAQDTACYSSCALLTALLHLEGFRPAKQQDARQHIGNLDTTVAVGLGSLHLRVCFRPRCVSNKPRRCSSKAKTENGGNEVRKQMGASTAVAACQLRVHRPRHCLRLCHRTPTVLPVRKTTHSVSRAPPMKDAGSSVPEPFLTSRGLACSSRVDSGEVGNSALCGVPSLSLMLSTQRER